MKGGIDGYRLADSNITVVHRKSSATATFMGTAERLLDIHVVLIYPYSVR